MKNEFILPTNKGWIVMWKDEKGKSHSTNYIYKSKSKAQTKANELMLDVQKEHYIAECNY